MRNMNINLMTFINKDVFAVNKRVRGPCKMDLGAKLNIFAELTNRAR